MRVSQGGNFAMEKVERAGRVAFATETREVNFVKVYSK